MQAFSDAQKALVARTLPEMALEEAENGGDLMHYMRVAVGLGRVSRAGQGRVRAGEPGG